MTEIQKAEDYHATRLAAIDIKFQNRLASARQDLNGVTQKWEQVYGEEDRMPRYSSGWFYFPFMIVLCLAEVPVNRLSFELFFSESPILSLLIALLCGVLLVTLAHFFGISARRFRYSAKRGSAVASSLILAFSGTLIVFICYGVSVLRQGYLTFILEGDPSFSEMLMNEGVAEAAALVLTNELQIEGIIFFVINLTIVMVGILAAFFCHDPHPDFEKLDREVKRAKQILAAVEKQQGDAKAAEERRFGAELRRLKGDPIR